MSLLKKLIEICKIVNTHGIKGELKAIHLCDSPEILLEIDELYSQDGKTILKIVSCRIHNNSVLLQFEGIDSIDKAEKLKNTILYTKRNYFNLPKNTFFINDLIGLEVYDHNSDFLYGIITDVFKTGSNDVYVIKGNDREYLVPAIKECIIKIDIENKKMFIKPLKGLFDWLNLIF